MTWVVTGIAREASPRCSCEGKGTHEHDVGGDGDCSGGVFQVQQREGEGGRQVSDREGGEESSPPRCNYEGAPRQR